MSNIDALSVFQKDGTTPAKLIKLYGDMIAPVMAGALSVQLKNTNYAGPIMAGGVEVYRLVTAGSENYGTARTASEGDKVKKEKVFVPIDVNKEIVEEWKSDEAQRAGLENLVANRREAHMLSMLNTLDTAFFAEAVAEGSVVDVSEATDENEAVQLVIQTLEKVENDFIHKGIDRTQIRVTLTPEVFDALEDHINTLPNPNGGGVNIDVYKRVRIYPNINQSVDIIAMAQGSIAQPVNVVPYSQEIVPLSNDTAVKSFYDFGTEAVMEDLVMYANLAETPSA